MNGASSRLRGSGDEGGGGTGGDARCEGGEGSIGGGMKSRVCSVSDVTLISSSLEGPSGPVMSEWLCVWLGLKQVSSRK